MGDDRENMDGRLVQPKLLENHKKQAKSQKDPSLMLLGDHEDNRLEGGNNNDSLTGASGDDILYGHDGDDLLNGGPDNDFLDGGIGNDVLIGELGHNFYCLSKGFDVLNGGYHLALRFEHVIAQKNVIYIPQNIPKSRHIIRDFCMQDAVICVEYNPKKDNRRSLIKQWKEAFALAKTVTVAAPHEDKAEIFYKVQAGNDTVLYIKKTPDLNYNAERGLDPNDFNVIATARMPDPKKFIKNPSILLDHALSLFKSK